MEEKDLHSENKIIVNFLQKTLFPSKRKEPHTSFEKKIQMKHLRDDFIVKIVVKSKARHNQII
jgi:hypothetical protein